MLSKFKDSCRSAGWMVVFAWFFFGGLGHFFATDFFVSIVPPWLPWPLAAVYVSGVFELLGAAGLLLHSTRKAAGLGLFLLTLAVSPVNIYMWQHSERFPEMSPTFLGLRLIVQVALLACIWWSTQTSGASRCSSSSV